MMIMILKLLLLLLQCTQTHSISTDFVPPFELKILPTKSGLNSDALTLLQDTVQYYLRVGFDDLLMANKNSVTDLVLDVEGYYWYKGHNASFAHYADDADQDASSSSNSNQRSVMVENVPSEPCNDCPNYSILKFTGNVEFRLLNEFSKSVTTETAIAILDEETTKKYILQALHASPYEMLWGVTEMDFAKKFVMAEFEYDDGLNEKDDSSSNGWIIILASVCVVLFSIFVVGTIYRYYRQRQWDFVNEMGKEDIEIARNVGKLRKEKQGAFVFNTSTLSFDRLGRKDELLIPTVQTSDISSSSSSPNSKSSSHSISSPSMQSASYPPPKMEDGNIVHLNGTHGGNNLNYATPPRFQVNKNTFVDDRSPGSRHALTPDSIGNPSLHRIVNDLEGEMDGLMNNLESDVKDILIDLENQEKVTSPLSPPISSIQMDSEQLMNINPEHNVRTSNSESNDLLGLSENHQHDEEQQQRNHLIGNNAPISSPGTELPMNSTLTATPTVTYTDKDASLDRSTSIDIDSNYEFGQKLNLRKWETMAEDDKVFHFGKGKRVTFADALPEI